MSELDAKENLTAEATAVQTAESAGGSEEATGGHHAGFGDADFGAVAFADAETREILNLLGEGDAGGCACGSGGCC